MSARKLLSSQFIYQDKSSALDYAEAALDLLPLLTPRSLQNTDKQHLLLQAAGLASDAAAIALLTQQTPAKAVSWLEAGRGVLASAIQDLRTDTSDLHQQHPKLAATFDKLRAILDAPTRNDRLVSQEGSLFNPPQSEADRRRKADEQLNETLQEIRKKPGFDRFLLPPTTAELVAAAVDGPVVMINVSPHRCDALVVQKTGIQCIELSKISYEDIRKRRQTISSPTPRILKWLWVGIVGPVLERLGFVHTLSDEIWPRVWWIPTGPLVGFPLHAAGYHLDGSGRTTLDRVVSSYATSLRSIIQTRQQPRQQPRLERATRNLVLVAMENTPGPGELQFVGQELNAVKAVWGSVDMITVTPDKRHSEVRSALEDCEIFHFAGHGGTHPTQPLQSLLLLDDWKDNPLTVESLLDTNLHRRQPFLAYLSACGTGQVLEDRATDENIHLNSACQLAGIRHVIGTLWSVDDELCVKMAELTYEVLAQQDLSDSSVSYGLHVASQRLRDEWVSNVQGVEGNADVGQGSNVGRHGRPTEGSMSNKLLWVPYVHYGV
ncbi:hypothetical protein PG991_001733 [Apiospora marii]|uniref:CHAT domain-containing protein n=1 Tax=Apiospora marii TaxID=335849 RepID=A0ABR1SQI5_9PEZI